jgi:hypothetical protein
VAVASALNVKKVDVVDEIVGVIAIVVIVISAAMNAAKVVAIKTKHVHKMNVLRVKIVRNKSVVSNHNKAVRRVNRASRASHVNIRTIKLQQMMHHVKRDQKVKNAVDAVAVVVDAIVARVSMHHSK